MFLRKYQNPGYGAELNEALDSLNPLSLTRVLENDDERK
jgi:hypothetical protein